VKVRAGLSVAIRESGYARNDYWGKYSALFNGKKYDNESFALSHGTLIAITDSSGGDLYLSTKESSISLRLEGR
jgi:hypothetical protein